MAFAEPKAGGIHTDAMRPKIGVVVALQREASAISRGGLGTSSGASVVCAGQGPRCAGTSARLLVADGVDALVSLGFSAGLRYDLKSGSVIVAASVLGPEGDTVNCDLAWAERSLDVLAPVDAAIGHAVEIATVVSGTDEKRALARRSAADVADMESHAVASVAQDSAIPCLIVRVVLDGVDFRTPAWLAGVIGVGGRVSATRLVRGLVMHPGDGMALARLGRAAKMAEARLSGVAALLASGGVAFR